MNREMFDKVFRMVVKAVRGYNNKVNFVFYKEYLTDNDFVADVFDRFYKLYKTGKFEYRSDFEMQGYIRKLTSFYLMDRMNKNTKMPKIIDAAGENGADKFYVFNGMSAEEVLELNDLINVIFSEILKLKNKKEMFYLYLRLTLGLKTADLAEMVGDSAAAVSVYLSKARKQLEQELEKEGLALSKISKVHTINKIHKVSIDVINSFSSGKLGKALKLIFINRLSIKDAAGKLSVDEAELKKELLKSIPEIIKQSRIRHSAVTAARQVEDAAMDKAFSLISYMLLDGRETLGEFLEMTIEEKSIGYDEICEKLSISPVTLNKILADEILPSAELAKKFSVLLDVPEDILMQLAGNAKKIERVQEVMRKEAMPEMDKLREKLMKKYGIK